MGATAATGGVAALIPVLPNHRFDEAAPVRYLAGRPPGSEGGGPVTLRQFQGGRSKPTFHVQTEAGAYVLRKKPPGTQLPAMDRLIAWLLAHLPEEDEAAIAHGDFSLGDLILHPTEPRSVAVLDRELCTVGHPLADLGYICLAYHIAPRPDGIAGTGIPTEREFVARCCASAGRAVLATLDVVIAFSMFRLAAIVASVWRRALDGNAADPSAIGYRDRYRGLAERAWEIAQAMG